MVGYGVYFLVANSFTMTEVNKLLASRYFFALLLTRLLAVIKPRVSFTPLKITCVLHRFTATFY